MTSPYYQYGIELVRRQAASYVGTAGGLVGAVMDTALALNQWSHLAIVVQRIAGAVLRQRRPGQHQAAHRDLTARGQLMRVGADASPWQFYRGVLDNLRIYNRTLTATEVQSDMNTAAIAP